MRNDETHDTYVDGEPTDTCQLCGTVYADLNTQACTVVNPEPWSVRVLPAGNNQGASDHVAVVDRDGRIICDDLTYYPTPLRPVNASRIAASPDLLFACIQSRALFCTLLGEEQDLQVSAQNLTKIGVLSTKIGVLSLAIGKAQGTH